MQVNSVFLVRIIVLVGIRDISTWGRHPTTWGATELLEILWGLLAHVPSLISRLGHVSALRRREWLPLPTFAFERVITLQSWLLWEVLRWSLAREATQTLDEVILLKLSTNLEIIDVLEQLSEVV